MGRVMEAPKTALTDENLLVGTWKLESMVYEAIARSELDRTRAYWQTGCSRCLAATA
jgi:hypothetical protein